MSASAAILNQEFLKALGLTANALAKAIELPPNRITAILKDERGITGDTAIRLGNASPRESMCLLDSPANG
jgi:addiction module HigA family antidote